MGLIEAFLAGGVALIGQGVYTLRTGDIRLLGFLMRSSPRAGGGGRSGRLTAGMFFVGSGLWVLHVPLVSSLRGVPLAGWAASRPGPLLVAATCTALAAFLLGWPAVFIKWLSSSYPQIPAGEPWVPLIPRGIGVGALLIAIQVVAGLLYHASQIGPR